MATQLEDGSWEIQGRRLRFPVRIRDATAASALYLVPAVGASALLTGTGLRPVSIAGRTPLVLLLVDYRDGDLDSYHELGIAFLVRSATGRVGGYVHQLPVTETFTMEAGRALWGLPKWLSRMELSISRAGATCRLTENGEHVLTAALRTSTPRLPGQIRATVTTLAPRGEALLVTPTRVRAGGVRLGFGGAGVQLGRGHPMADELAALGLPRRALVTSTVEHLGLELPPSTATPLL